MGKRILGIVGSYRKDGIIDLMVTEVLSSAKKHGAEIEKIYLTDRHIEFCTNCRLCLQEEGESPGKCIHSDDMDDILAKYEASDGIVIGAPVNIYNLNAITRRFMERLVCFAYWPWGSQCKPKLRKKSKGKKAVLITSTVMPAFMGRIQTGAVRALRIIAKTMGAKIISTIFVGLVAESEKPVLPKRSIRKAEKAGKKLAG